MFVLFTMSKQIVVSVSDEMFVYFKTRCDEMGVSQSKAIRECLEHCGMIPRDYRFIRGKAKAVTTASLSVIRDTAEWKRRRDLYFPHPDETGHAPRPKKKRTLKWRPKP